MPRCADPRAARHSASHGKGWRRGARAAGLALLVGGVAAAGIAPAGTADGTPATSASATDTPGAAARAFGEVPSLDERAATGFAEAAVGHALPDFEMRDRRGQPVKLSSYRGKPLLVSFIYTGCFQVCPTQTRALYEAVRGLDRVLGEHQFNVISIGFNQPFDTPEAMRAFAAQQRIGDRNWEFLSPAGRDVDALTRAFGFSWVATPAGFDHVLGVTVVDAGGRIHAQVLGDKLRADRLGKPLRELLLDQPARASVTIDTVIERVRILCTIYDPDTGEYRYDYKLIVEIIGGALFFSTVFAYLFAEWRRQRRQRRTPCPAPARPVSGSTA